MGTLLAAHALGGLEPPRSDRAARQEAMKAIEAVANQLNNTKAVCKRSYVHPDVVALYVEGELPELWAEGPSRDGRWLLAEERKLLHVLRQTRARARRARQAERRAAA